MAKTRELVRRRKAIANIKKITRTMELIATARFKKAMDRASEAEAYTRRIGELDSPSFAVRARATRELSQLADLAEPGLRKFLTGQLSIETRFASRSLSVTMKSFPERFTLPKIILLAPMLLAAWERQGGASSGQEKTSFTSTRSLP